MAKTPLFDSIRRAANLAFAARRAKVAPRDLVQRLAEQRLTRREFLQRTGVAAAALSVPLIGQQGCSDDAKKPSAGENIVIIGGGLAGLHCAYRLKQSGIRATVYEGQTRIGGRTFTARGLFPNSQTCELGGELIDTGHATMQALAVELGLTLDEVKTGGDAGFVEDLYYFNGGLVSEADIVDLFSPVAARMADAVTAGEGDEAEFARLDALSISDWLAGEGAADSLLQSILNISYTGEYGLEAGEQSVWNLLYLIGYDEPDPFRIFGDSDERYHLHEGSDAIATKLGEVLAGQVETGRILTKVSALSDGRYRVSFDTKEVTADRVVFALPFTLLREVDLSESGLSADKLTVIDELGYGTNAKLMSGYTSRVWQVAHDTSGSSFTDLGYQSTWDSSRGQAGDSGILTNFVGGARGVAMGSGTAEDRLQEVLPSFETLWPGTQAAYVANSAVRMHWPTAPFNKGSYACYRTGQWAFFGTERLPEGRLYFCGEHTSEDFQGFMEGAAESGARAADEILGVDEALVYRPRRRRAQNRVAVMAR